jgi:molybdate transport system substrate-binding protein
MEGFDIPGEAGTLRLISAGALRNALAAAATAYSAQDRVGVAAVADTAGGIEKRLAAGEPADVIGSSLDSLNRLAAAGVVAGAPEALGSARVALGVRAGHAAPDISTVERFVAALHGAKRIARGDPSGGGTGAIYLVSLFERLGLMDMVAAKSVVRVGGRNVMAAVGEGLADFGLTQSTEIAGVPGVELGGWLPDELQQTTVYAIAINARAADPEGARRFIEWLRTPTGARHIEDAGFFPA